MNRPLVMVLAASCLAAVSCEEKKPAAPSQPPASTPAPAATGASLPAVPTGITVPTGVTAPTAAMEEAKSKTVTAIQSGLDALKTQIDALELKARTAAADAKPKLDAAVAELRAQWNSLAGELKDLKADASAGWQKLATQAQSSYDTLKASVTDAMNKFK